jgi:glycine/D-amino acid oxidase-like deaminating enzyme/nitrite reductase/ring-hydroxylating ferredoxin subunit
MKNTLDAKITSGAHTSYWLESTSPITYSPLRKNLETDVVIIGGGITGVTTAYQLLLSGKKVVLIEDGNIGSGETGRTTAHAVTALDDRYFRLESIYGEKKTKLIAESHLAAIDYIEQTVLKEQIECEFERLPGYLFLHPSDERDSLIKERISAQKAGVTVEEIPYVPGTNEKVPCLKFSAQAQFHPLKYLKGLCEVIDKLGGQIFTGSHAAKINHNGIETVDGFKVIAKHVIVATNSPVNNKYVIHMKQNAFRTYVIGCTIKKGSLPRALWWDTGNHEINNEVPPYHYVRVQDYNDTHDLLICGGEDHPTGIADDKKINEADRYSLLEYWLRKRFNIEQVVIQWSGQVLEPIDSLAFIGNNPLDRSNVYISTGDSGNGITYGAIAARLLTDLIVGEKNPFEKIYSPARLQIIKVGKNYVQELAGGILAWFKSRDESSLPVELGKILVNEAKILDVEGEKFAAFRDDDGKLHFLNAECKHLGCTVKWNSDEKTWDCPCHGSRYTHEGKVINGPANSNLIDYTNPQKTKTILHDVI